MENKGPVLSSADDDPALIAEVQDFIASRKLLFLASLTPGGRSHASTAPFLVVDGRFYLFLSDLSEHAVNLKTNPHASLMLAADEADTRQPFARLRLSFDVEAALIGRDDPRWTPLLERIGERFGSVIDQLRTLADFNLFELVPANGRYVKGFGKAYRIGRL
ncbi:pyridoxamine 5'-phosphate oxidase family protein [Marinobacterium aestuariivivens]|uniref:Pyridoxamine 5'-phosphate oxidase family protein n=1 Tax=Marinobacterium aestuariivivens TaxID=1698799 RepID=A0ABW1ZXM4_9GAMM